MSRTQCRSTKTKHSQTSAVLCAVLCCAVLCAGGFQALPGLLTGDPIWPQLYFRRRDEMYCERTDASNVSSAYAGWAGEGGGPPGLLAWPLAL